MKLLRCRQCLDIFNLTYDVKSCGCGATKGRYLENGWDAVYSGEHAVPIGFDNFAFYRAIENQPEAGMGERFDAFIIPKDCPTFIKVGEEVVDHHINLIGP